MSSTQKYTGKRKETEGPSRKLKARRSKSQPTVSEEKSVVATSNFQDFTPFDFSSYVIKPSQHTQVITKNVVLSGVTQRGLAVGLYTVGNPGTICNISITGSFESEIDQAFDQGILLSTNLNWIVGYKPNGMSLSTILNELNAPIIDEDFLDQVNNTLSNGKLVEAPDFYTDMTKIILNGSGSVLTSGILQGNGTLKGSVQTKYSPNNSPSARKIQVQKKDQLFFYVKSDDLKASVGCNLTIRFSYYTE